MTRAAARSSTSASGTIFSMAREAIREAFADAPPSENRCEVLLLVDEGGVARELRIYWNPPPLASRDRYSGYTRLDQEEVLLSSARHLLPDVNVRVVRNSPPETL